MSTWHLHWQPTSGLGRLLWCLHTQWYCTWQTPLLERLPNWDAGSALCSTEKHFTSAANSLDREKRCRGEGADKAGLLWADEQEEDASVPDKRHSFPPFAHNTQKRWYLTPGLIPSGQWLFQINTVIHAPVDSSPRCNLRVCRASCGIFLLKQLMWFQHGMNCWRHFYLFLASTEHCSES